MKSRQSKPGKFLNFKKFPILKILSILVVGSLVILFPIIVKKPFPIHLGILVFLWALLGNSWNIIGGYGGRFAMWHAVLFGLGAYTSSFLYNQFHLSPWIGIFGGMIIASLVSLFIGWPTFKLVGAYYAMVTIGIGGIAQTLFLNFPLVGDTRGLYLKILDHPSFWDFQFGKSKIEYYYIALAFMLMGGLVVFLLEKSKLGFYLQAIREDEVAARSLGVNVQGSLQLAGVISACLAAAGGTFYAQYIRYIDPNSVMIWTITNQIIVVSSFGGTGTFWGAMIGSLVLIPLTELTRVTFGGTGNAFDQLLYGALIVTIAVWQPQGLAGIIKTLRRKFQKG